MTTNINKPPTTPRAQKTPRDWYALTVEPSPEKPLVRMVYLRRVDLLRIELIFPPGQPPSALDADRPHYLRLICQGGAEFTVKCVNVISAGRLCAVLRRWADGGPGNA